MFVLCLAIIATVVLGGVFAAARRGHQIVDICRRTRLALATAERQTAAPGSAAVADLADLLPSSTTLPSTALPDQRWTTPSQMAAGRDDAADWVSNLQRDGFRRGLFRQWALSGGGTLQAEVLQFPSHGDALAFQDWVIGGSCTNASDVFAVAGDPTAVGLRIDWPGGDISDQVSFVRGSRRYLAGVRMGDAPDRDLVLSIERDVAGTAR